MVEQIDECLIERQEIGVVHASVHSEVVPRRTEPSVLTEPLYRRRDVGVVIRLERVLENEIAVGLELMSLVVGQTVRHRVGVHHLLRLRAPQPREVILSARRPT